MRLLCVVTFMASVGVGCHTSPQQKEAKALSKGQSLLARQDYARAAIEFRVAAQVMPRDPEPNYQLGLACLGMRDFRTAIGAFRKAILLNPGHAGAQLK